MRCVLITGLSGAGKSLAVKIMEDIGFFCVDNLPPALLTKFGEMCMQDPKKFEKIAFVTDIRGGELFNDLIPSLDTLSHMGIVYEILFLDASDETLVKRYKENRRSHPLSHGSSLAKAINQERKILENIKSRANMIIDTSQLSIKQFKEKLTEYFQGVRSDTVLPVNLVSFGFKYGLPLECDLVFDVRFIPNPFYIAAMKNLTGKNKKVADFVLDAQETVEFVEKLCSMIDFLIPNYIKEGKTSLVIGIGCTGGRHRSVAITENLYKRYSNNSDNIKIYMEHRDIDKDINENKK